MKAGELQKILACEVFDEQMIKLVLTYGSTTIKWDLESVICGSEWEEGAENECWLCGKDEDDDTGIENVDL
jgi:hypothetical protein